MTYVTLDIFEKMCRVGGIENEFEYMELYRRKLIPTKLLPKTPATYYQKPKQGRVIHKRNTTELFEKKYGRKFDCHNKADKKSLKNIPSINFLKR